MKDKEIKVVSDFYDTLTQQQKKELFIEFIDLLKGGEYINICLGDDDASPDVYWAYSGESLI